MKIITYKEIAKMINKTEAGIKYIKKTNPELLEILQLGCTCKKKNININDLKNEDLGGKGINPLALPK